MSVPPVVVLTGPTGSGKSDWALRLADVLPIEIISVDSVQVFRALNIGTAKPMAAARTRVRHHLLDIRDPSEAYSAGDFVRDTRRALAQIRARGRLPVLVGGTMMYLRALLRGIAELPPAAPALRLKIEAEGAQLGWEAMHARLAQVDPRAAAKIHPNDPQRIGRALEVYRLSGRPISEWQASTQAPLEEVKWLRFALIPSDRVAHRLALERRFRQMIEDGLVQEVRALAARPDLHAELPALRSVGYRQLWAYCQGEITLEESCRLAIIATGQLAKRQLTWLRSETAFERLDPADATGLGRIINAIQSAGFVAEESHRC